MNAYNFLLNDTININNRILNFEYSENLDDAASPFSFETVDMDYGLVTGNKLNRIVVRDRVTNTLVYEGWFTDLEHTTDVNKFKYSGFDAGFYINKNEVIIQFDKNKNIGKAINELCEENEINIISIPTFTKTVEKIYKDVAVSEVLKDLIKLEADKGGKKNIYIDCKRGGLEIKEYQKKQNLSAIIANNITVSAYDTVNDVKVTKSIQELKNSVLYADNSDKSIKYKKAEDSSSKATYGLLRAVEKADTNTKNNLQKLADDKLVELNKVKETFELSMLGDYNIQKGVIVDLKIGEYGINDTYLIKSVKHNIDSKKEAVSIELTKYEWE